ncbi:1035_t:CDS:2 [Racocetra fulgida]|uniref:1034_t:CDS:1 n=1 Tax=Racocetra fulgida TaxID=60492 RepID=A0A9N9B8V1_9GLOM|nr:1034_t:CDS:2 [Racocetra fulgida]CAG8559620.1 1035_t:CDS:2 [Racocetra fulgida]
MLKANNKKIDVNNLNLDRSYTLEEFEFINDQLKTRTLEIDGQPVNLFDFDKNGKLIPMSQSLYSREIVVAEIVRQLGEWNIWTKQNGCITLLQGGFDFDVGCGRMIRAPDIAYTSKEIHRSLNKKQNWSFRGEPFTPVFVDVVGEDFLPRFTLEIWKIEHAISQRESVSPEPTENNRNLD